MIIGVRSNFQGLITFLIDLTYHAFLINRLLFNTPAFKSFNKSIVLSQCLLIIDGRP
jgi:hypothetical protein